MAPDEYSIGGGKLKLKGSKVNDGRVEKKKKKKGLKKKDAAESGDAQNQDLAESQATKEKDQQELNDEEADQPADAGSSKTETEKKYEEIRKKRLHERLQREGVKTHKERVEDLNKYLSRLSEHHDMPKIGPG